MEQKQAKMPFNIVLVVLYSVLVQLRNNSTLACVIILKYTVFFMDLILDLVTCDNNPVPLLFKICIHLWTTVKQIIMATVINPRALIESEVWSSTNWSNPVCIRIESYAGDFSRTDITHTCCRSYLPRDVWSHR